MSKCISTAQAWTKRLSRSWDRSSSIILNIIIIILLNILLLHIIILHLLFRNIIILHLLFRHSIWTSKNEKIYHDLPRNLH